MSVPLLIVVGTSLLLVVALVVFVVTLLGARRASRGRDWDSPPQPGAQMLGRGGPVDTSLDGLEVELSQDALSATLLTPLRTGEWKPPEEPAPLQALEDASLAGRIAEYRPAPDIVDPAYSVPQYEPWQVAATEPEPTVGEVDSVVLGDGQPEPDSDDELDAEIAALAVEDHSPQVLEPAPSFEFVTEPEVVPEATTPSPEPEPTPSTQGPVPEPTPTAEPEPETVLAPALVLEQAPAAETAQWSPPVSDAVPSADAPGGEAQDSDDDSAFWNGLLATQSREQAQASTPRETARVEVKVAPTEVSRPAETIAAPEPTAPPRPARPRVRVHVADSVDAVRPDGAADAPGASMVMTADKRGRESVDPHMVMAAPVEMWFGESRVGVKAGTATYDRFRKYADVLLEDFRASTRTDM